MTTLLNVYEAAVQNAEMNDLDVSNWADEFESYAEATEELFLTQQQSDLMAKCHNDFVQSNGGTDNFYHLVEKKLLDVEV